MSAPLPNDTLLTVPQIAIFGCGPIGLITAAVAHAYSARKIVAFDNNPERVEFARRYISPITGRPIIDLVIQNGDIPDGPLPGNKGSHGANGHAHGQENGHGAGVTDGEMPPQDEPEKHGHEHSAADTKWEWAKLMVADWVEQAGLTEEEGFDRVIEATGSQDPVMFAIAAAKQGGNCASTFRLPLTRSTSYFA